MGKMLRHGFTTGSAAAAAVKAALLSLLTNRAPGKVDIPLPEEGRITVAVNCVETFDGYARAVVIKDGGDDPDVTHRARIFCTVRFIPGVEPDRVLIEGGKGVGKVMKPGLPIPPGEPAINPGPRKQLRKVVRECFALTGAKQRGVVVRIEVEDGEKIAQKTLNPRLGIVGGISILGTRGTVIPFSHEAYKETITLSMNVAEALGMDTIALSTGGKSEKFLMRLLPELPGEACIQVADFFAFALKEAARRHFTRVIYACFFGKLVKVAQGHEYTHAKTSLIDFGLLARWCRAVGIEGRRARAVAVANTAREVLGIVSDDEHGGTFVHFLMEKALSAGRRFMGPGMTLEIYLFSFDGTLLGKVK